MSILIKNISSLVTCNSNGANSKVGKQMQEISEIKNGAMLFDEKIQWLGTTDQSDELIKEGKINPEKILDYTNKTIIPGFVDSHTHIIFGGNRANEFGKRLRGYTYQQIAEEGGGIVSTVRATRDATIESLVARGKELALNAMKHGTTSIEVKSGYGLSLESEIKMLRAIKELKKQVPLHISTTFLGAHDFPPEYKDNRDYYVDLICNEMLPQVAEEKLAEFCDAFIDEGYFTLAQGEKILRAGLEYGMKLKVHCDELATFGSAELAASLGAVSADHLLYISDAGIDALIKAGTVASLLPGTAYFIRMQYAPARKLIDRNAIVSLSTDCNPGSCFTENMQLILSLAVINMRMTAEEALNAATINGAAAVCRSAETGSLEIGKKADFSVINSDTYIDMFYHFGVNHIKEVWIDGKNRIE